MNFLIFALAVSLLGNGASAVPVNVTSMIDLGTINVDGVGTIHVVTPWAGNIQVNIWPFPSTSFPSFTLAWIILPLNKLSLYMTMLIPGKTRT